MLIEKHFYDLFDKCINLAFSNPQRRSSINFFCKQYCDYLNPENTSVKPSMFITCLENLLKEESFNLPEFKTLYSDLKGDQVLHQTFIQENPDFSEELIEQKKLMEYKIASACKTPIIHLQTGYDIKTFIQSDFNDAMVLVSKKNKYFYESSLNYIYLHRKRISESDLLNMSATGAFICMTNDLFQKELFPEMHLKLLGILARCKVLFLAYQGNLSPKFYDLLMDQFIQNKNQEIVLNTIKILSFLSADHFTEKTIPFLVSFLLQKSTEQEADIESTLNILRKITANTDKIKLIFDFRDLLTRLLQSLEHHENEIIKESCDVILNKLYLYDANELTISGSRVCSPLTLERARTLYEDILIRDPSCQEAHAGLRKVTSNLAEINGYVLEPEEKTSDNSKKTDRSILNTESSADVNPCKKRKKNDVPSYNDWRFLLGLPEDPSNEVEKEEPGYHP